MNAKGLRAIADNTQNSPIVDCALRQAADAIDKLESDLMELQRRFANEQAKCEGLEVKLREATSK